jgi:hypothetical protein
MQGNTFLHEALLSKNIKIYEKVRTVLTTRYLKEEICNMQGQTIIDLYN